MRGARNPGRGRLRALVVVAGVALLAGSFAQGPLLGEGFLARPSAAYADTAPPTGTPATVSADALPTVQVDGVVWSQAVVGNTVWAGGSFATARPAGAAPGVSTVARRNLLAYDIRTGALLPAIAPSLNAQANAVAASPDGRRIYVGGDFTTANGAAHSRIAAFDAATGALLGGFSGSLDGRVKAIVATSTTVYVGGSFGTADGRGRSRLAAFDATTGALLGWAPSANGRVDAMVLAPGGTKLVIGGAFTSVNGANTYGMAAVHPSTGAVLPWAATSVVRNAGVNASITSLSTDGTRIYGSGYVYGSGGNLEGAFAADPSTGAIVWVEDCHGDSYSTYPSGGVLYVVGHPHYCGNLPGGFPQTNPWTYHRALAFTTAPSTQTLSGNSEGSYASFGGRPAPTLLTWWPTIDAGTYTGQHQGAWSVAGNGTYVSLGGEFPSVNGVRQQGLVRFAVRAAAPNRRGPEVSGSALTPRVTTLDVPGARVSWQADWDQDNATLTYQLVRDGNTATPVCTATRRSSFYDRPGMGCTDTAVAPGSTHTYRLLVTDPLGNRATSGTVTYTVPSGARSLGAYARDVRADGATAYYRLGEGGTTAYDWAGWGDTTVTGATGTTGGAVAGDGGRTFDGSTTAFVSGQQVKAPNTFSVEAWFRTTTTRGGKLVGYGNTLPTVGGSSSYDRHVYLDDSGHLVFGVFSGGGARTLTTSGRYNDGVWHHLVATLGSGGMALYVDGALRGRNTAVTTGQTFYGFWRIGGDTVTGWPSAPTSAYVAGSLDEVAIYPVALTETQVARHFANRWR